MTTDLTTRIVFEDAEALVIDKPAGLPLDRPRAGGESLDDHIESLKLGFHRPPLPVHRLDRDTSGCLLLARNTKAHKRFSAAFEARQVEKVYLGVLAGDAPGDEGTIALNLSKISSVKDGWRMIAAKKGKDAVTHWRVVERRQGPNGAPLTLIEFRPETGRTHQIRVHALTGLGHALLGDPIYGDGKPSGMTKRTMLHAASIAVERGDKPPIMASAPMPADFTALGFAEPVLTAQAAGPTAEPVSAEPSDG